MVRYSKRTIDKANRINLQAELRDRLGILHITDKPKMYLYPAGYLLILQKFNKPNLPEYAVEVEIDELGRFFIPQEIMDKLSWKENDIVYF